MSEADFQIALGYRSVSDALGDFMEREVERPDRGGCENDSSSRANSSMRSNRLAVSEKT